MSAWSGTDSDRVVSGGLWAGLLAALHGAAFPRDERWDEATMTDLLAMPGCLALLDPPGRSPLGFALLLLASDEAELLTLAVDPAARRQGAGGRLLAASAAAAARRGAHSLLLEVSTGNAAALRLYRHAGFVEVGRRRSYYHDGTDALVLRRRLDPR